MHAAHSRRNRPLAALLASLLALLGLLVTYQSAGSSPASAAARPAPHTLAVTHAQLWYTVRQGDTLTSIAKAVYGHASRWPALWYVNRHRVHNPNAITVGQRLELSAWHPAKDWILTRAMAAVPPPPAPAVRHHYRTVSVAEPAQAAAPAQAPAAVQPGGTYIGSGSFRQCVLRAESGGNYSAYNPSSGAGGAYQFLQSTWSALGFPGSPQNASPAMQDAAFAKEYAQSGTAAWSPYDGC